MILEQRDGERFIALRQRAVTHHVGEHDSGQPALCWDGLRHAGGI